MKTLAERGAAITTEGEMDPWVLVAVVLIAVLVGATLPVLFQAHQTLRETRRTISRLDATVEPTIRQIEAVVKRVDRIGASIEPHVGEVADTLTSVAQLARPLRQVHENLVTLATVTAALAPAARAAYEAFTHAPEPGDRTAVADEEDRPSDPNDRT